MGVGGGGDGGDGVGRRWCSCGVGVVGGAGVADGGGGHQDTENSRRVEEGLVLRLRDGTCSQQVSVEVEAEEMVVVVSHRDLIRSDQIRSWFYKSSE